MWENLIDHLSSILSSNDKISVVFDYEEGQFDSQPAAVIVPADNESEYSTSLNNERVYAFSVYLFVQRGEQFYNDKECDEVLRGLVDTVIDDFDKNWNLSGLTLPTGYQMLYMEAAPSTWGYANRENLYRMAEIKLRVHINVDTNQIS